MIFKELAVGDKFRFQMEPKSVVHMRVEILVPEGRPAIMKNAYVVLEGRGDIGTVSEANPKVGVEPVLQVVG